VGWICRGRSALARSAGSAGAYVRRGRIMRAGPPGRRFRGGDGAARGGKRAVDGRAARTPQVVGGRRRSDDRASPREGGSAGRSVGDGVRGRGRDAGAVQLKEGGDRTRPASGGEKKLRLVDPATDGGETANRPPAPVTESVAELPSVCRDGTAGWIRMTRRTGEAGGTAVGVIGCHGRPVCPKKGARQDDSGCREKRIMKGGRQELALGGGRTPGGRTGGPWTFVRAAHVAARDARQGGDACLW